jgi:hypothetical protein
LTDENNEKKTCETSGVAEDSCTCNECVPMFIDVTTPLIEARNIIETTEKFADLLQLLNYLRNFGFETSMSDDGQYMTLNPPSLPDVYWTQCRGCRYPFLIHHKDMPRVLCDSCTRIASSKGEGTPRYYEDLFTYIEFNLESNRIPTEYESELPLTEEFCEAHSFDFNVIRQRLNATGGYDPGEVMMNSMYSIPWFDKLPLKLGGVDT